MGATLGIVLGGLGYSSTTLNLIGLCFVVGALIGCLILGFLLSYKPKYKLSIVILSVMAALSILGVGTYATTNNEFMMALSTFLGGFSIVSLMVPLYDLAVEINYPLGESYSNTLLNMTGQFYSILIIEI